jgi:hypothetical protein
MSIQSDIISALAGVAGNRVYPDAAPEGVTPPLVIVRRTLYEPLALLLGSSGIAKSTFTFECWGAKPSLIGQLTTSQSKMAKSSALATASEVKAAIIGGTAGSPFRTYFFEAVDGEDFDPQTLEMMEPVSASFWHQDQ